MGEGSTPWRAARCRDTRSPSITSSNSRAVRVSPSALTRITAAACGSISSPVTSKRLSSRGCWSASESRTHAQPVPGALPTGDLVVARLGQGRGEGRELAVLVHLGLPAVGDGAGHAGAVEDGHGVADQLGDLGCPGLDRLGAPLEVGGGAVDLGVDGRGGLGERGELGRDAEHVADGGARRHPGGQSDHRDPVGAGGVGELSAGGRDHPVARRAPRRPRSRRGSPRCCPSSSSREPRHRPAPKRAARTRAPSAAPWSAGRRARRRRGRPRSPSRPCRTRSRRTRRAWASGGRSRFSRARRGGDREWRGPCRAAPRSRASAGRRPRRSSHYPALCPAPTTTPLSSASGTTTASGDRIAPSTEAPAPTGAAREQGRAGDRGALGDGAARTDDRAGADRGAGPDGGSRLDHRGCRDARVGVDLGAVRDQQAVIPDEAARRGVDAALEDVPARLQVAVRRAYVHPVAIQSANYRPSPTRRGKTSRSIETATSGAIRSSTDRSRK